MILQYVKDWKPRFEVNQLVQGKVARSAIRQLLTCILLTMTFRVDLESHQVELSLRSGPVEMTIRDFHEGQKVDGVIKKKEKYGVFIQIKDTQISGLCHKSEVSSQCNERLVC
jgi:rRNA biogenesis protein RRP5